MISEKEHKNVGNFSNLLMTNHFPSVVADFVTAEEVAGNGGEGLIWPNFFSKFLIDFQRFKQIASQPNDN